MKTKRRGRKPKDKFKYENNEYDELIIKKMKILFKITIKLFKINEELNMVKIYFLIILN